MEAPALRGPPNFADARERRLTRLSECEAFQILSDAFTGRFDESFAKRPVAVEQRRPCIPVWVGGEAGERFARKRRSRNGHKIREFPAPFDVDSDGASSHRNGDAAAGVAYVELHRSASVILIEAGLSVNVGVEAQRAGRTSQHWSQ